MNNPMGFVCSLCSREYPFSTRDFRCTCGGPFRLVFSPYPLPVSRLKERERTIWRYRESLPVSHSENIVSLGEGCTPLIPFSRRDFPNLLLKLDYLNPSGSYKDRGASVLVSMLKELKVSECLDDSSGNAGAAIAAYAAKAGIDCRIYCPADTLEGKLVQIRAYGAKLCKIPGTRADTAAAIQEEAQRVYYASHNWNPFFLQGIKTMAFEIAEQFQWRVPEAIICPVGYGSIYLGLYKGFQELKLQGTIDRLPRLIGIQAQAVSPIYQAFSQGMSRVDKVPSKHTLAEGIACIHPVRGEKILEIARQTRGCFEVVSEEEILEGWRELNRQGVYVEPTSAVVVRAIDRLARKGLLNREETIVLILTGFGLKATEQMSAFIES